jgi:hypothetical protein
MGSQVEEALPAVGFGTKRFPGCGGDGEHTGGGQILDGDPGLLAHRVQEDVLLGFQAYQDAEDIEELQ